MTLKEENKSWSIILVTILMLSSAITISPSVISDSEKPLLNYDGAFDWRLVQGWNLVSCPMEAVYREGINPFFDSEDALDWVSWYLENNYMVSDPGLRMARQIGQDYQIYNYTEPEWLSFEIDTVHGYWVYLSIPGDYFIPFDAMNAPSPFPGMAEAWLEPGWNLMGFQHDYTSWWPTTPTASMFTDGTICPNLALGPLSKIVVSQWDSAVQWWNSYEVEHGFPGIPSKNWSWDFSYSPMQGNGYMIWVDSPVMLTYSTTFGCVPGGDEVFSGSVPNPRMTESNIVSSATLSHYHNPTLPLNSETPGSTLTDNKADPNPLGTPETVRARVAPATDGTHAALSGNLPNGIFYVWEQAETFSPGVSVATFGVNTKDIEVDMTGTWSYNLLFADCIGDAGSIWDEWAMGEQAVMIIEVFDDQSVTGRNYTMIFEEDAMDGDGSTLFGLNSAQNALTVINDPYEISNNIQAHTCVIGIAPQATGFEVAALFDGYGVYKSSAPITQSNQGTYLGDATLNGGVWEYTDTSWTGTSYYAVKVKWDGGTYPFYAPLYSYGMSSDVMVYHNDFSCPPEASNLQASPNSHDGNTLSKHVTITATISESLADATPDTITGAWIRIDGMWLGNMNPADGAWDETSEDVQYLYNFPGTFSEGSHTYDVMGGDSGDGYNMTWVSGTFWVNDTTVPIFYCVSPTPPDGIKKLPGEDIYVYTRYEDFTNQGLTTLYYWNASESYRAHSVQMSVYSIEYGCYIVTSWCQFQTYGDLGDIITYEVETSDTASTPNGPMVTFQRTIVLSYPDPPQNPCPVYGYTYQYDGSGGVYTPALIPADVSVSWYDTSLFAQATGADSSWETCQYSIDLLNYEPGATAYCNVTNNYMWNNPGWNHTQLDQYTGGCHQDIVCGIPYDVRIIMPFENQMIESNGMYPIHYEIVDLWGIRAPGYFTFADGPMTVMAESFMFPEQSNGVLPGPRVFNGLMDGGYCWDSMTIASPFGPWWINVTENWGLDMNSHLTPWGEWYLDPTLPTYQDNRDWDNVTVFVTGGWFSWQLRQGWNLVSCPMEAVYREGINPFFDSEDALDWVSWYLENNYMVSDPGLRMARQIGQDYQIYNYTEPEWQSFPIDTVHGYWVYLSIPGDYFIPFDAINASSPPGMAEAWLEPGWNLMGFQHDYTSWWPTTPTASMFTDGTICPNLALGPLSKIVVSQWDSAMQWWNSYEVEHGFPGIPSKNWVWDFSYSPMPGNGYMIWVDSPVMLTYSTTFGCVPGGDEACGVGAPLPALETASPSLISINHVGPKAMNSADTPPQNPCPVYGYTYQYDGSGGVYTPALIPADVSVSWYDTSLFAQATGADSSWETCQYSIDLLNYEPGATAYCNVTNNYMWNNPGWNHTQLDQYAGGCHQDIVCGIPYDVRIIMPFENQMIESNGMYPIQYEIVDLWGIRAPGYFTFADGPMTVMAGSFMFLEQSNAVLPAERVFNGLMDGGYCWDWMTIISPFGPWWINVTENWGFDSNSYLTPWGEWYLDPTLPTYQDNRDWDNITVFVTGTSFDIALHNGWNFISFPLILENTSVGDVLSSITGEWDVVKYYDASDPIDHWKTYRVGGTANDFWNLDHKMGFWLHLTSASASLILSGDMPTTTIINLKSGWNMIGYPSYTDRLASETLPGEADIVSVYDGNQTAFIRDELDLSSIMMSRGNAYWVHVTSDCNWMINA